MNISIITVYNSENSGSYFQAYALAEFLKKEGHIPYFYKRETKGTSHDFQFILGGAIKRLFGGRFHEAARKVKRYYYFQKAQKKFKVIDTTSAEWKSIDCCVIGSDTLWDFDSAYFRKNREVFLGTKFPDKKMITYAISIGNTPLSCFQNDELISNGMNNLDSISVRDEKTKNVVKEITGKDATIVLDPTFLLDIEEYYSLEKKIDYSDYILLYCFETIRQEQIQSLLKLKETEGLKIISFGRIRKWADFTVNADPEKFLSCFHNAKYVITDTFHGTIFSIIYKKRFAVLTDEKNKVNDLLNRLDLADRISTDDQTMVSVLKKEPAYDRSEHIINVLRNESIAYIRNHIDNMKEDT